MLQRIIDKLMGYIEQSGYFLARLNETFYWHVDIDTKISWTIILIMVFLYFMVKKFVLDKKLDARELFILISFYLFALLTIIASYANVREIINRQNSQYSFFVITGIVLIFVVSVVWFGSADDAKNKSKYILGALYVPIILLMITNGRILEEKFESLKSLLPRSEASFLTILPGEFTSLQIGGTVNLDNVRFLEELISKIGVVEEAAIVGRMDEEDSNKFVKPFVFIVLKKGQQKSDDLKEDIKSEIIDKINDLGLSHYYYPRWIEFTDRLPKDDNKKVDNVKLQKQVKNWSNLFTVEQ